MKSATTMRTSTNTKKKKSGTVHKNRSKLISEKYKPVRICQRDGCSQSLKVRQKKYCSPICRNKAKTGTIYNSTYNKKYATDKLKEYLELCEKGHEPTLIPSGTSYIVLQNVRLPTKLDFAHFIGVVGKTIYNWEEEYIEFAYAMELLMDIQQTYLINNGLSGRYTPKIAALMLGVNHGMIERKQVDNNHKMLGIIKYFYQRVDEIEQAQNDAGQ